MMSQRDACFEFQTDLDPARLVFIDETWATTNMMRSHGRSRRGERLRMGYPHGHRKTTTCGFRFNPATDSDLKPASHSGTKPATIPI